jgi:hypothetical protein
MLTPARHISLSEAGGIPAPVRYLFREKNKKPSRISFTRKNNGPLILELGLERPEKASKMGVTGISVCIKLLISLVPRSINEEVIEASKEG